VEVKIGIQLAPRELVIETAMSADEFEHVVSEAFADDQLLKLTDTKGNTVLVAVAKIAYVELSPTEQRQVGFGSR
jgi:Protein of unknown function (DUF3107)